MLTSDAVKQAKPGPKDQKIFDEKGLYLLVTSTGGKLWRFKYRFGGKEKLLALGSFPAVSLKKARADREAAKRALAEGRDPAAERRKAKRERKAAAESTFEIVVRAWLKQQAATRKAITIDKATSRIEQYLIPAIGKKPMRDIELRDLREILKKVETKEKYETAHRLRQLLRKIFTYAINEELVEPRDNPTLYLTAAPKPKTEHRAALIDPDEVAGLLLALDDYKGTLPVKAALRLSPLLFVRPGELRHAEWSEIDFDRAEWRIPGEKTKMGGDLIVPLSRQAVAILREVYAVTGRGTFVFPSGRGGGRPMSDNAILAALRRSGITADEQTGHGFRAVARTLLDEELRERLDWIELQLGHAVKDVNGEAYNRTKFLEARTEMMQRWADYLDALKAAKAKGVPAAKVGAKFRARAVASTAT